jgi:hypothetical protein
MPAAHLAHRAAARYNKCNDLFITFYIQEVQSMRIAYETMLAEFERVLAKYGFSPERAHEAAEIFAQNSLAGVFSHGLNRFPPRGGIPAQGRD